MDKKRFLWFLLAAAVFVAVGFAGVRSAARAREASAKYAEQAASMFTGLSSGSEGSLSLPSEPYIARVDVDGTIMSSSGNPVSGGTGYDHDALLKYVEALTADENNKGILLYIDSPGGEMKASEATQENIMAAILKSGRGA